MRHELQGIWTMNDLKIKIFADGATPELIMHHCDNPLVAGFTTNPSLLKAAGVKDYAHYGKILTRYTKNKPISFEVIGDDPATMLAQAKIINSWGDEHGGTIYVKIPIINTKGEFMGPLIKQCADLGIKLNITAIFTASQVRQLAPFLSRNVPSVVSVFAGRVADILHDPIPMVHECAQILADNPSTELLWASTRQVWSAIEAQRCGCHIITMPFDMIDKLAKRGTNPLDLSLAAVKDFYKAAQDAGLSL